MNPPKPTALKILEGTVRRDRVNPNEPQPAPGAVPPPYLPTTGPARVAWDRITPVLLRNRVLTEADGDALALGCMALAEFLAARHRRDGWRRAADAWKRYQSTLRDFGMTPSSRTRVSTAPPETGDPLAEWEAGAR